MSSSSSVLVSSSDWAWLPINLLDSVLERLISITDYIRFGAVCKHWQSAASHQKDHRKKSCHKQLPILMKIATEEDSRPAELLSVAQGGQLRQLKYVPYYIECLDNIPGRGMSFAGSSHGWLAYNDNFVLTLLNPFNGSSITLPALIQPPEADPRTEAYIDLVELSADPCLCPNSFEILVQYTSVEYNEFGEIELLTSWLAYFRAGDDAWTRIGDGSFAFKVSGLVYSKGQFVALTIPTADDGIVSGTIEDYVLESSGGDLLLVKMIGSLQISYDYCFKVFKLLHADGDHMPRWVEIKSIGSDVLLLGDHGTAMCVSASDFPQCVPNSIYFREALYKLNDLNLTEGWIKILDILDETTLLWVPPTLV